MAVNYGQVAIVPKGVWNAEAQYKVNNLVEYDGSSYVAKVQPPVGTLPTDTSYWQVSAAGTKKATPDSLGTVMPDGTTTEIKEDGKLSAKTAQQNALGVVKGSDDITVGEDGKMTLNTTFEQATELANIIAGEAIKSVLGKVSKAIATTMSLDENALLKNMISGIDVNDGNKVPSSAYIHSLVERIGMGTALEGGFDNLTAGLNSVNNNLSNSGIPIVKKITDLYSIKTSGFYYYDAGTTNAPQSSRGGMIIANYLSDSWISLIVVPYASSKLYTNTKYNNTWVGWAESATKNDIPTRYGGTGIEIPVGKSCKISVTKDGLFAALLFVQGTTGSGFGTFMIQGYGVEGGPSRYRVNSLNTSGTQSGITCTVGDGAYFMVKNGTDNKVKMVFEEFFNYSTFTHSII